MIRTLISILSLGLIAATPLAYASAPASCLQRATDRQLLDEISYRMSGGNTGSGAQVVAHCDTSNYFSVTVTELDSGQEDSKSWHVGSSSLCDKAAQVVHRKTSGNTINQNLMIGFCDSSNYFRRALLKATGEVQDMGSKHMGSRSNCEAAMNQL